MERTVALARLSEMVAADQRPVLSSESVALLLDQFAVADANGLGPADLGWIGTWALNAAAAEGWRRKAGRVAGDFTFGADGASFNKGDVLAHCTEMARRYAALDHGTIQVNDTDVTDYRVGRLIL